MKKDTRDLLLEVALELFATKGYHATKVSDVVKKAGVAQGTFYWYFESKEEIVLKIMAEGRKKLLEVVHSGYRKEEGNIRDMVDSSKRLMKKLLSFASNNRNLMILLLLKGQGGDEKLRNAISETLVAIEKEFANNIQRAIELQMLEDRDCVEFQAQMLTSLVTGTISRWLFGPMHELNYQPSLSIDKVVDEMVRYEFFGLIGQGGRQ
ncbi:MULTISPECIES: TetR/AcrR family transcriptional regulator [Gracilibacillus]|uniref:TetR family transcriptional regulator n=1 Tax=Gracilibacillus dipsosauri TaxID=178340 RepID=A0A317KWW0_9BACI|nr:TetR/AcrR family transcriptional regulator [Gracilibacillus dipsosauri]PWU67604.1 TetR family transcriptional regulator [Gracilibacillus dipsosauri]